MRVIVVVVTRGFRFVPLLPIGGAVFPFIVIVRSAAAVSDDKNVRERKGGDATSIVEEREREAKSTFGQSVTGILNGVCHNVARKLGAEQREEREAN